MNEAERERGHKERERETERINPVKSNGYNSIRKSETLFPTDRLSNRNLKYLARASRYAWLLRTYALNIHIIHISEVHSIRLNYCVHYSENVTHLISIQFENDYSDYLIKSTLSWLHIYFENSSGPGHFVYPSRLIWRIMYVRNKSVNLVLRTFYYKISRESRQSEKNITYTLEMGNNIQSGHWHCSEQLELHLNNEQNMMM